MAQAVGLGHTSVRRIWHARGLKPHLTRGFKLSNAKRFVEKVQDVIGLYLGTIRNFVRGGRLKQIRRLPPSAAPTGFRA